MICRVIYCIGLQSLSLSPIQLSLNLFVIVFFFFFSVPGSHDSFTFWVDVHAPVGPDQKPYVKYLATMFSVLAKKVMVKWSMTQVMSSDRCHVQTQ